MAITYVKTSGYIRDFMIAKFRSNPIDIPSSHYLYSYLENYILPNPDVRKITLESFSQNALSQKMANDGGGDYNFIPSETELGDFLPVKLPDSIYVGKHLTKTNDTWQFSGEGVTFFRQKIKSLFWLELDSFLSGYSLSCSIINEPFYKEYGVDKFLEKYKIRTEYKETILRNERRQKNKEIATSPNTSL